MTEITAKSFWIFKQNLPPTLLILSHLAGYDFEDADLQAIEYGLAGTSNEKDIWWTYQLVGNRIIDLRFACEENTDVIFIELSFSNELSSQIDLAIFIVQDFNLYHRH